MVSSTVILKRKPLLLMKLILLRNTLYSDNLSKESKSMSVILELNTLEILHDKKIDSYHFLNQEKAQST